MTFAGQFATVPSYIYQKKEIPLTRKQKAQAKCYLILRDGTERLGVVHAYSGKQVQVFVRQWAIEQGKEAEYEAGRLEAHEQPPQMCNPANPQQRCDAHKIGVAKGAHQCESRPRRKPAGSRATNDAPLDESQADR